MYILIIFFECDIISTNIFFINNGGIRMALSEAQRKANDKYIKENYKQVKLSMPKDEAEKLEDFLLKNGIKSKAGFIRQAIQEKMERYEHQ